MCVGVGVGVGAGVGEGVSYNIGQTVWNFVSWWQLTYFAAFHCISFHTIGKKVRQPPRSRLLEHYIKLHN